MAGTVHRGGTVEHVQIDRAAATLLGTGVAGGALLLLRPPGGAAAGYPACPFLAATGLDCPFCGGLRGTYALLQGDLAASLDHNILVPFMALAFVAGGLWWGLRRLRGPVVVAWPRGRERTVMWAALLLLGGYWVVRNLPFLPYLDSGVG